MSVETIAGGRYRVERTLGDGAMAQVVLAHDGELGRQVAIKVLDERLVTDGEYRARFSREARLAAGLSHPNVVTIFDAGEADGRPFIVMEYVEGVTLQERLQREGRLDPDEVRDVAVQVCAGLEHAHAQGLVHRDLKPGNLIQRGDGTVKIADFGIARGVYGTELTEAGSIVGTAAYLAPEQAEAARVTPQTDLYALGVVLYELLTGERPWQVTSLADLARRRSEPVPTLPPDVPADLREAVTRCLDADPAKRPPSAAALVQTLTAVDEGATAALPSSPSPVRVARARRGPRERPAATWAAIGIIMLLVVLAAIGFAALAREDGGGGGGLQRATPTQRIAPIPDGATPAEDARALAEWLRENAR